jgi:hypothetical protein
MGLSSNLLILLSPTVAILFLPTKILPMILTFNLSDRKVKEGQLAVILIMRYLTKQDASLSPMRSPTKTYSSKGMTRLASPPIN